MSAKHPREMATVSFLMVKNAQYATKKATQQTNVIAIQIGLQAGMEGPSHANALSAAGGIWIKIVRPKMGKMPRGIP
jgi:hypothetical protein